MLLSSLPTYFTPSVSIIQLPFFLSLSLQSLSLISLSFSIYLSLFLSLPLSLYLCPPTHHIYQVSSLQKNNSTFLHFFPPTKIWRRKNLLWKYRFKILFAFICDIFLLFSLFQCYRLTIYIRFQIRKKCYRDIFALFSSRKKWRKKNLSQFFLSLSPPDSQYILGLKLTKCYCDIFAIFF